MNEARARPTEPSSRPPRRARRAGWALAGALSLGALGAGAPAADVRLRAAGLLLRFEGAREPAWVASYGEHRVTVEEASAPRRARRYVPDGADAAPEVVLLHGVHAEGMAEPRLVAFARALASAGVRVTTPDLPHLREGRLVPALVDDLIAACREAAAGRPVGVVGISIGGGAAVRAAARAGLDDGGPIAWVASIGGHGRLSRVAQWHLEDPHADPYGREILRRQWPVATDDELRDAVRANAPTLDSLSPELVAGDIDVPIFLVHGADDPIVPSGETPRLATALGDRARAVLVSPVLRHAEYERPPTLAERWELVSWMATVLGAPRALAFRER